MSDILEEIQELSNKFSNLFEVEGLGNPAVDVPPSQNKIKKDRKTKDGKVEVVSVEDELFPYEGNKREQYRQKILDTINNMIQGTATLEDLLQIVRQKKAPLKEAMELMEELLLERNKENKIKKNKAIEDIGQEYINGREEEGEDLDPYGDDPKQWGRDAVSSFGDTLGVKRSIPKLADKLEYSGISELGRKLRKKPFYDKEGRNKIIDGLYLQALNKAKKENSKEALKEALSLMEEIINEVSVKKWKEAAKNSIEGRKEAASDASDRFGEVVYPFRGEVNDPGHKLGNAWDKAEQRADRAEQLAKNLPDSNKSATKLKQAAKKVVDKRDKDNEEAVDKLQGAIDKFKEKPYDERTDKDYSDLAKVQNEWVDKQKKENQARNLVGKPERRPEKNSEGKHKLKEQGFIDRSKEA